MIKFPSTEEELSTELLTAVYQELQPGIKITDFSIDESVNCGEGLASTADRIVLSLSYGGVVPDNMPTQVMLKTMLLSPHAPKEMYENEVRFYRDIRPNIDLETPQIYASAFDNASGQFGVIMEDLNLRQARFPNATSDVSLSEVEGLVRTLAKLHGAFWNSPKFSNELKWISTPMKGGMSDIFINFGLDLIKDQVEKNIFKQDLIAPIGLNLDQMWEKLWAFESSALSLPQTLLHGDTHIANTYLLSESDGGLLDWQLMVRGNWAHDVSYVIVTALTPEQRQQHESHLLDLYLATLSEYTSASVPSRSEAWDLYRQSIMWGLVVGWLITPPSNYGEGITTANISKLVEAVRDLESFNC